jgi:hypothetical protein
VARSWPLVGAIAAPAPSPSTTKSPAAAAKLGYAELSDGRGGTNVELFVLPDGFDKARSLAAFKDALYPLRRAHCSGCHSTQNKSGSGGQAPLHADPDVKLAHEYALARVNFRDPKNSYFVVRMAIDRHNCFAGNCGVAAGQMLAAVTAWRESGFRHDSPGSPRRRRGHEDHGRTGFGVDRRLKTFTATAPVSFPIRDRRPGFVGCCHIGWVTFPAAYCLTISVSPDVKMSKVFWRGRWCVSRSLHVPPEDPGPGQPGKLFDAPVDGAVQPWTLSGLNP